MTIFDMTQRAYLNSEAKGFWKGLDHTDVSVRLAKLALICSEVGEAIEAVRNDDIPNLAEELADIVIRVGDLAYKLDLDLETEVLAKMRVNEARPMIHERLA